VLAHVRIILGHTPLVKMGNVTIRESCGEPVQIISGEDISMNYYSLHEVIEEIGLKLPGGLHQEAYRIHQPKVGARLTRLPDISNNVGSVKLFLNTLLLLHSLERVFSSAFFVVLLIGLDKHGSFVI
jgi:hypothetical protein